MTIIMELLIAAALALTSASTGGSNNPGYEGQPGNQSHINSSSTGNPGFPNPGLVGYEGQPGNQGRH